MNRVRQIIAAGRRFLLLNPPVEDIAAYGLWNTPLGLLRVAAGLRASEKDLTFFDLLDDPGLRLPPPSIPPEERPDGRHGFWKTAIPKPPELHMVPRRYHRFGASDDHLRTLLADLPHPDAVFIATGMTYWYRTVLRTAELVREHFPAVPVIAGGTAARLIPERFEADGLIVERGDLFPGIDLRVVSDLTARYTAYPIELVRGCPYRCRYCASSIFHADTGLNDPAVQAESLRAWATATGRRDAVFFDDALLWRKGEHLRKFLSLFDPGLFRFHIPNGLHLREVDEDIAQLLSRYRFSPLRFGFETGGDRFDSKKEGVHLADTLAILHRAGYRPRDLGVYLLCGMPGQTLREVEDAVDLVVAAGGRPYLNEYSPVPGTPLFDEHLAESARDISAEPLWQNNSLSAYRSPVFTPSAMRRLKDRLASVYRDQDRERFS